MLEGSLQLLATSHIVLSHVLILLRIVVVLVFLCNRWLEVRVGTSKRFVRGHVHGVVALRHAVERIVNVYLLSARVCLEVVLIQLLVAGVFILVAAVYSVL